MSNRKLARPFALLSVAVIAGAIECAAPAAQVDPPSIDDLIAQLANRSCHDSSSPHEVCRRSDSPTSWFWSLLFLSRGKYECPLGAARCLEQLGPQAKRAVPALIEARLEGPNDFDTGDGIIAPRSAIASALGAIGDPRAIDPLGLAIEEARPPDRAVTASVRREPSALREIVRALGRFGREAAGHGSKVASILEDRNADTGFFDAQREAFEEAWAMRLAGDGIRTGVPKGENFVIPWEAPAAARTRIDRASTNYLRDLESRAHDGLAHVAAEALGRLGDRRAIPLLRDTLSNRCAAAPAARALAELGASDPETIGSLEALLASKDHGPSSRAAAARALGSLGRARSLEPLSRVLLDPALREASAEALGEIGPAAAGALPLLRSIVAEPSLAVRTEKGGLHYSVEASRRASEKLAAARAIGRIAGSGARGMLAPYAADPDVGAVVRRSMKETGSGTPPARTPPRPR